CSCSTRCRMRCSAPTRWVLPSGAGLASPLRSSPVSWPRCWPSGSWGPPVSTPPFAGRAWSRSPRPTSMRRAAWWAGSGSGLPGGGTELRRGGIGDHPGHPLEGVQHPQGTLAVLAGGAERRRGPGGGAVPVRGDTQAVVHPLDPRDGSRRAVEPGLGQPLDRKAHPLFDLTVIGVGLRAQDREVAHFPEGAEGSLILGTVVDLQGCQGLPEEREPLRLLEGDLLISE